MKSCHVLQRNCLEDLIVRNCQVPPTTGKEILCFSTSIGTNWSRVRATQVTVGIHVRVGIAGDTCDSTPDHPTNNQSTNQIENGSINREHHQNEFNERQQSVWWVDGLMHQQSKKYNCCVSVIRLVTNRENNCLQYRGVVM